ncbi:hypothetical protein HY572_06525 [Candidatus Micrarchaeota archaeon]|nr:hypothetical protein [Candidatus Micrarchaeota archaeon]
MGLGAWSEFHGDLFGHFQRFVREKGSRILNVTVDSRIHGYVRSPSGPVRNVAEHQNTLSVEIQHPNPATAEEFERQLDAILDRHFQNHSSPWLHKYEEDHVPSRTVVRFSAHGPPTSLLPPMRNVRDRLKTL